MKKYILFWLIFFALFFGIVAVTYYLRIDADIVVALLLILYFVFQGIALYQARKQKDSKWIISSMIVQTLFAVCSPLYYSNFGDPQIEFI